MVTDVGGLNDRGFNHLAYVGMLQAQKSLGVQIRVAESRSPAVAAFVRTAKEIAEAAADDERHAAVTSPV
jgi:basic membrane lipoprotein Med (substrate-binding protein (PBP1-ABC) superfamily)